MSIYVTGDNHAYVEGLGESAQDASTGVWHFESPQYLAKRNDGEEFAGFIDRYGVAELEEKFKKLKTELGPLDRDNIQNYMDWGKTVVYKLDCGEGGCAV